MTSEANRHGMLYTYFNSEDFLEPKNINEHLDDSIGLLARRKKRGGGRILVDTRGEIMGKNGEKFHYIPIHPQLASDKSQGEIMSYETYKSISRAPVPQTGFPFEISSLTAASSEIKPSRTNLSYRHYLRALRLPSLFDSIDFKIRPQSYDSLYSSTCPKIDPSSSPSSRNPGGNNSSMN